MSYARGPFRRNFWNWQALVLAVLLAVAVVVLTARYQRMTGDYGGSGPTYYQPTEANVTP